MKVLVTGGCGYIGSHTIVSLIQSGYEVVSVDSLINSKERTFEGIKEITGVDVQNYVIDLTDYEATRQVFVEHPDIDGIIHFAALKSVAESTQEPLKYFDNNVNSLLTVMRAMNEYDVKHLIFSSSCSVYGNAKELPVTEQTPLQEAESPYARTKQIGEQMITDFCKRHADRNAVLLRYFNPAGAHPSAHIGEDALDLSIYLVPVIMETAVGLREKMMVFGDKYDTRDGSCIRDYIHIMDLAEAHVKCLDHLVADDQASNCETFNVGIGAGVTVLEAIKAFERVTGKSLNYEIGPARDGDVIAIYADPSHSIKTLGWQPTRSIDDIMRSAWDWENRRKELYA